jgi:hypothetical protein
VHRPCILRIPSRWDTPEHKVEVIDQVTAASNQIALKAVVPLSADTVEKVFVAAGVKS